MCILVPYRGVSAVQRRSDRKAASDAQLLDNFWPGQIGLILLQQVSDSWDQHLRDSWQSWKQRWQFWHHPEISSITCLVKHKMATVSSKFNRGVSLQSFWDSFTTLLTHFLSFSCWGVLSPEESRTGEKAADARQQKGSESTHWTLNTWHSNLDYLK